MQEETKFTPEIRSAVLDTVHHEAYKQLAYFIMDELTLEQIQAKVGFDELQYKTMVDHIAKISSEAVVVEPTPEDAPTTVTPAVTSVTPDATNIPVEGTQAGTGNIQASQPEAPTAPVVDNGGTNTSSEVKTEELTA